MRRGIAVAGALAVFVPLTLLVGPSSGAPAPSGSANLSLTKSDSPDPVAAGAALTYSIQVANAGPDAATEATVTDKLPKGVSFVSAISTQGSCKVQGKNPKVTCALGTLASSTGPLYNVTPVTVTIVVLAPQKSGTISNTASIKSDLKDPKSKDNSATATTRVIGAGSPTCAGRQATIVGTAAADVLTGTGGDDVILARAGSDRIRSFGGRDLICAGRGNDGVRSGARSDEVLAGAGADRLFGQGGGDELRGGRGRDHLIGGRGPDLLVGGAGVDRCFGGPGPDAFRGC